MKIKKLTLARCGAIPGSGMVLTIAIGVWLVGAPMYVAIAEGDAFPSNPDPATLGPPPAVTVELVEPLAVRALSGPSVECVPPPDVPTLTPPYLEATLMPGECIEENKTAHILGAPPKGDVLIAFDLTGSMWEELNNVKANSVNIMNAIRAVIPDTQFGVVSHMDYNGLFEGCGYGDQYGSGSDYPYSLDQPITDDTGAVSSAINALPAGFGDDGPEDYTRVLYESYSDAAIGWRSGAKKIILYWQDSVPHDCNYPLDCGGSGTTGPDPGRDATVGTADDLDLAAVLQGVADNDVTLIALHSGDLTSLWDCYAAKTGGDAIQINWDGTIPDGTDIATFIADLIGTEVGHIDTLTLEVCDPEYADWLAAVDPPAYEDVEIVEPTDFAFDIRICVPDPTPDGLYCFKVCVVGDGAVYAEQEVCITVINEIEVPIDIKPMSCPNPLNVVGKGLLPVAILGTCDFDVMTVDPATVGLSREGVVDCYGDPVVVKPIRWAWEDVGTPFGGELCCCHRLGADGFVDMTLKFDMQEVVTKLQLTAVMGETLPLAVTGQLVECAGGIRMRGEDCLWVLK